VLDAGCGTGASTAALLAAAPYASVTAVDASRRMLDRAAAKRWPDAVRFVHAPVERLAAAGVDGPFDAVFCAYLLRNCSDPDAVLAALRRLLRPGGRLGLHEYTLSGARARRAVWSTVCWGIVIPAGALGQGGPALYRHLWRSVLDFDTAGELRDRLRRNGFECVRVGPAGGWQRGIVHSFVARRPAGEAA
jgi:ubiquinone/menaquinone biosynthesis C-methylase UbiE